MARTLAGLPAGTRVTDYISLGAVAGKVKVFNRHEGLIPRMLHVRYIVAFDFLRAAESGYGTVFCCPGALTAYRTSLVRQVMGAWPKDRSG